MRNVAARRPPTRKEFLLAMRTAGSPLGAVLASWLVLGITILLAFGRAAAEDGPNPFDAALVS